MSDFEIKDSGTREEFESGMVRDTEDGKVDYTLILDGPMLDRWAEHLTKGAKKYAPRNWMQATGQAELDRFRRSALRHFLQWMRGESDEDHAAAVLFNINGAEYTRQHMEWVPKVTEPGKGPAPIVLPVADFGIGAQVRVRFNVNSSYAGKPGVICGVGDALDWRVEFASGYQTEFNEEELTAQ